MGADGARWRKSFMKKKFLVGAAVATAATVMLTVSACGGGNDEQTTESSTETTTETTAETTEETTDEEDEDEDVEYDTYSPEEQASIDAEEASLQAEEDAGGDEEKTFEWREGVVPTTEAETIIIHETYDMSTRPADLIDVEDEPTDPEETATADPNEPPGSGKGAKVTKNTSGDLVKE